MPLCREAIIVKSGRGWQEASILKCWSWGCPMCGDLRRSRLIAETCAGKPQTFLTLTLRRSEAETPAVAAKILVRAWRTLRDRLIYHHKLASLPFMAVLEAHRSGWPHLHIFLRMPYIDQKEISCWMSWIANSPIVDVRRIANAGHAIFYASKYITKSNTKFGTCKRYWQSRDYDLREDSFLGPFDIPGETVEVVNMSLNRWIELTIKRGWSIERPCLHKAVARAPPSHTGH